ncbi:uncharacterized protein GGS22DRAFT_169205, partial [Annulohypoxylon maeteangense]|uniref:uncharacterized protein n=1 Tax=Annulohypoxylon maeteangense TaxID=1927788 RepID=UPI0020078B3B
MSLKIHINAKQVHDAISFLPSLFLSSCYRVSFRGRGRRLVLFISFASLLRDPKRSLAIRLHQRVLDHDRSQLYIDVDVAAQRIRSTRRCSIL